MVSYIAFHLIYPISAFMLAAAPAIASAPDYRRNAPVTGSEVVIVLIGCAAILAFGVALMVAWNRYSGPPDRITRRDG